jgi:lysyl-tRNA synthetase class 2
MAKRVFGKLAFYEIADATGTIQLYMEKSLIDESMPANGSEDSPFEDLKSLVDVGDIIGVRGGIKRTDKGELSVLVKQYSMLTKSILPLPDKFKGLTDVNIRYRRRRVTSHLCLKRDLRASTVPLLFEYLFLHLAHAC